MGIKIKGKDLSLILMIFLAVLYYVLKMSTVYQEAYKVILFLANFFGVLKIVSKQKYNKKLIYISIIGLIISVVGFLVIHNYSLLTLFVFSVVCAQEDKNQIISLLMNSILICLLFLCVIGKAPEGNILGMETGIIMLLYVCKKKGKLSVFSALIMGLISLSVSYITSSKVVGVVMIVVLVLLLLSKFKFGKALLTSKFVELIFPISCFFNFYLAFIRGMEKIPFLSAFIPRNVETLVVSLAKIIDAAMSWRLILTFQSLGYFGFSFIGGNVDVQSMGFDENTYFYLDSGYADILQRWGLFFLIVFLVLLTIIMKYFIKHKSYEMVVAGVALALWSVNEPILNIVVWNFLIIFSVQAIYDFVTTGRKSFLTGKNRYQLMKY